MVSGLLEDVPEAGAQNNPILVPYLSNFLEIISKMVRALPEAARDVHGLPVGITHVVYPKVYPSQQDVTGSIILVNSLLEDAIRPYIYQVSNQHLGGLLRVVDFLDIPSLTNALSSFIADRVLGYMRKFITPKSTPDLLKDDLGAVLLRDGFGDLPDPVLVQILKHVKLRTIGTPEKTIADYIGEKGQPPKMLRYNSNTIDLSKERITGLLGLDLILPKAKLKHLIFNIIPF